MGSGIQQTLGGPGVEEVEEVASYSEMAEANDRWWYELGYAAGYAEGLRADG